MRKSRRATPEITLLCTFWDGKDYHPRDELKLNGQDVIVKRDRHVPAKRGVMIYEDKKNNIAYVLIASIKGKTTAITRQGHLRFHMEASTGIYSVKYMRPGLSPVAISRRGERTRLSDSAVVKKKESILITEETPYVVIQFW